MIIWGTKSRVIKGRRLNDACFNCGSKPMHSYGLMNTFSIYFVPMFPTSRVAGARCGSCKYAFEGNELGAAERKIREELFDTGATIRAWAGSIIVVALVVFGMFGAASSKRKELALLAQPRLNDLYVVDTTKILTDANDTTKYALLRVMRVEPTKVVTWISNMTYSRTSGVDSDIRKGRIWKSDYYIQVPFEVERAQLVSLHKSDAILSVERRDDAPPTLPLEPAEPQAQQPEQK